MVIILRKEKFLVSKFDPRLVKAERYAFTPNSGLRAYFEHVRTGQPVEYRTSFYRGKSTTSVLHAWIRQLEPVREAWPSLYEYEIDLANKVGPMSIMKPLDQRLDDIRSYYESILLDSQPIMTEAIRRALNEWRAVSRLRRRNITNTLADMKLSTNSGLPYFTKRRRVVDSTALSFLHNSFEGWSSAAWYPMPGEPLRLMMGSTKDLAAVLGWRGQEGGPSGDDVKQRVVWMFPFLVNIYELSVYQPLILAAQKHGLVPAWIGMESVDREVTQLFDTKGENDLIICTDFSAFDQHFNADMANCANSMLRALFAKTETMEEWFQDVFWIKYRIPLMIQENQIFEGPHGMGSGSGGTNCDETLTHRCLQHEAALTAGQQLNPHSQCLGDDGLLSYPGCTVDHVVSTYTAHGQEMNHSKQYASKSDCIYLRRWHHKDFRVDDVCVGVYSTCRALGRLMEQERYYDPEVYGPKFVALRQLSILENVKYHPMKEAFVAFCMKGDKYGLGTKIPGFLDHVVDEVKRAIDVIPSFLGYTQGVEFDPDGMDSWWIVNYLRKF